MGAQDKETREARRFEVAGVRDRQERAVAHVGLLAAAGNITIRTTEARLHDVGGPRRFVRPPLRLPSAMPMRVDALGWLPLTDEEEERLEVWLADMRRRTPNVEYVALPAHDTKSDPVTKRIVQWRFSCAGFVVFAYQEVTGSTLVNQGALPASDKATILAIWSALASRQQYLEELGLGAPPPWPVLLPGHVLRALSTVGADNDRSGLPYQPQTDDAWFPG